MARLIGPRRAKLGYAISPWLPEQGYPIGPGGINIGTWAAPGIVLEAFGDRLGGLLGRLGPRKVAYMAPS